MPRWNKGKRPEGNKRTAVLLANLMIDRSGYKLEALGPPLGVKSVQ
jgi:hypothetical protein